MAEAVVSLQWAAAEFSGTFLDPGPKGTSWTHEVLISCLPLVLVGLPCALLPLHTLCPLPDLFLVNVF